MKVITNFFDGLIIFVLSCCVLFILWLDIGVPDISPYIPYILISALVLFGIWVFYKIAKSEIAVPIFSMVCLIGILIAVSYFWAMSDKNNDGKEDNQVIMVVQPSGENPSVDLVYAEVNKQNTMSNLRSVAGISFSFSCC